MLKRRRLPHLDVPGRPQFLTFRLHDSLPAHRAFPSASVPAGVAFVAMDRILDQARSGPVYLRQPEIAELALASIRYGEELGHYSLHAWVIMPNHVHLLVTPQVSLSKLTRGMKGTIARRANLILNRTGHVFWQDESFDHLVRNQNEFKRIQSYIENNPVSAGLVGAPKEYRWSSAGILKVV